MKTARGPVLVLGGTGHYGRAIVGSLAIRDVPVRVLSRNAGHASRLLGEDVEVVEGDITRRDAREKALASVQAVVIAVSAFHPASIERMAATERDAVLALWEEAPRMDVHRAVYLSIYDIRPDIIEALDLESGRIKKAVEAGLAASELDWTVLGAPPSMQIFFAMIRGSTMVVPGGGPPALPTVAATDVGEIAAQTVLRPDLAGLRIRLAGPEALSFPEAAQRISATTGRRIRYQRIPLWPLRVVAAVSKPWNPYLFHVAKSVRLMNSFPAEIAAQTADDHQRLLRLFEYQPTTLEMEAQRWAEAQGKSDRRAAA